MGKQNNKVYVHLVWATADRTPVLTAEHQSWLWPAMGETARGVGCTLAVVGGTHDHVHVLVHLPLTLAVAELVRRLKGASTRVLHLRGLEGFAWQEGYAAFSVDYRQLTVVESYIRDQPQRHAGGQAKQHMENPIE